MSTPCDVTVNSNGHLLVTNSGHNCITSFTLDGTYVGRFNKGKMNCPMGLTTDLNGFVLLSQKVVMVVYVYLTKMVLVCVILDPAIVSYASY